MPRIGSISAAGNLRVNVNWSRGVREGITEVIDLAPIINSIKYFRPLRSDPELFATVHPIVYGAAVAWGEDDDIDLSADAILRLALENMTGDELRAFIQRQDLTETALAAILGYSRRQIVGFVNEGRLIPRVFALACKYLELVNPVEQSTLRDNATITILPHHGTSATASSGHPDLVTTNVLATGTNVEGAVQNVA
jgi:hypothetical protein